MYRAVIDLRMEIQEEKNGVCQGKIIPDSEMKDYGLKNNQLVTIVGATKNDCLTKVKEWINNAK